MINGMDLDQIVYSYLEYKWDWALCNIQMSDLQIFIDNFQHS